jgi:dihydrofolate reductase
MKLSLIVATAHNNVIGRNNELPWHLPQDLKYFKSHTLGKPIIMGRKTFESIGKPLPSRTNIVITRQKDWSFSGVLVAKNIAEALEIGQTFRNEQNNLAEEIVVIGGAEIYRHTLPIADRVYLTQIEADIDGADAYFPELSPTQWKLVSELPGERDANIKHKFLVFDRI